MAKLTPEEIKRTPHDQVLSRYRAMATWTPRNMRNVNQGNQGKKR